jgi:hypothetical protein
MNCYPSDNLSNIIDKEKQPIDINKMIGNTNVTKDLPYVAEKASLVNLLNEYMNKCHWIKKTEIVINNDLESLLELIKLGTVPINKYKSVTYFQEIQDNMFHSLKQMIETDYQTILEHSKANRVKNVKKYKMEKINAMIHCPKLLNYAELTANSSYFLNIEIKSNVAIKVFHSTDEELLLGSGKSIFINALDSIDMIYIEFEDQDLDLDTNSYHQYVKPYIIIQCYTLIDMYVLDKSIRLKKYDEEIETESERLMFQLSRLVKDGSYDFSSLRKVGPKIIESLTNKYKPISRNLEIKSLVSGSLDTDSDTMTKYITYIKSDNEDNILINDTNMSVIKISDFIDSPFGQISNLLSSMLYNKPYNIINTLTPILGLDNMYGLLEQYNHVEMVASSYSQHNDFAILEYYHKLHELPSIIPEMPSIFRLFDMTDMD